MSMLTERPAPTGGRGPILGLARAGLREPFTRRAHRQLLFCLIGVLCMAVTFAIVVALIQPDTAVSALRGALIFGLLLLLLVGTGGARRLGALHRRLAARWLGEQVPAPASFRRGRGLFGRLGPRLGDATGWRAVAYALLKLPLGVLQLIAVYFWAGVIDLTYPLWWRLFRNHPPHVRLSPVPFITPLGVFHARSFASTFGVFLVGAVMVLVAPWVTRAVTAVDRRLIRSLLGPGPMEERVRNLQQTRAHIVDDSAATLRRIERDLHDGTQAQLATLAMNLGQAKEKLEHGPEVPFDPAGALEMVEAAHRHAKEALIELRDIARGIHPPALDIGLDAALATLVARSAVPAVLHVELPSRPTRAIETIAYFSATELLANVAKHSQARHATVDVTTRRDWLLLQVTDDGIGGAQPGAGSGLSGLAERVGAVDGLLRVSSPPGGPTVITVELPLHA